ncbi:MAG: ImmA/IrrE family metallo-endopeptidase [Euryarchaeota archaeon]|nr:ImmA/IrrE family metallo-endopeptidase [Euryarchaeota archaeon]
MSESIPVNPDVLKWARETAGLSVDDVVRKMKRKRVTAETVLSWESGEDSPSYPQLERIAYKIYKRPLALFFFPEPPQEETPRQSFRTLPEYAIERLPERIRFLIRKARVMQLNLAELYDNANPASRHIVRDLSFDPSVSSEEMAATVRDYLGIDLSRQRRWNNSEEALKVWRDALEEHGVFIFKDAFRAEAFSGFCLYDEQFPIIYVNNSKPKNRQIFTLFHELAHLLFRTSGIDTPLDDYLDHLVGDSRRIEVLCNLFTGEFLVPRRDFEHRIRGIAINDESIQELAETYNVSREVILRKPLDKKLVEQEVYEENVSVSEHCLARKYRNAIGRPINIPE